MLKNVIIALVSFLIPTAFFVYREKRLNTQHRTELLDVEYKTHTKAFMSGWDQGAMHELGSMWYHLTEEQQEFWRVMHPGYQDPWHKI